MPPPNKGGYGCYACLCGIFMIIFGFGLGFIVGYFVLEKPTQVKPIDMRQESNEIENFSFLVGVLKGINYDELESDFQTYNKDYISPDYHILSNYTIKKLKEYKLDSVERISYEALFPAQDTSNYNGLKISNISGSTLFETNFKNASESYTSVFSPNANITGQTVFVNFAEDEDFRMMKENKVEYKNKIFVARCGKIHLEDMIRNAHKYGAKALLYFIDIYAPPLPQYMCTSISVYGNLRTFYYDFFPGKKLEPTPPRIPVQLMAYEEVEKLFQTDARGIWNRKVTAMWNAPFYVDRPVKNEFYQTLLGIHAVLEGRDLLNVVGKIFGEVEPDRYIIIGSQHSYLKNEYLNSGTSSLLQIAKAFQELMKKGWKPRRTILFASFDARNYGFLGAQRFLEGNFDDIVSKTVVYINLGSISANGLDIQASLSLNSTVLGVLNRLSAMNMLRDNDQPERISGPRGYTEITPFTYYTGIPSIDLGPSQICCDDTNSTDNSNVTEIYNRIAILLALEFTDAKILPINLRALVEEMSNSFDKLFSYDSHHKNELHYKHGISLNNLQKSIKLFKNEVDEFYLSLEFSGEQDPVKLRIVNDRLLQVERKLILNEEISHHLFRHAIFAPTSSNLLEVRAFQDIINLSEEIEKGDKKKQSDVLKNYIQTVVKVINEASAVVRSGRY